MTAFNYKGYGRIYTNLENIQDVENIIQELDDFEWGYYPKGLVTSWDYYPNVEYVGKFELDEDKFKQICKERNIPVFIFTFELRCNTLICNTPIGWYPREPLNKEQIQQLALGELK